MIKLIHILFIHLGIYVLKHVIFMLFVNLLINCVILALKNVEYQFNTNLNNIIILS